MSVNKQTPTTASSQSTRRMAMLLLALWAAILVGFFLVPLVAHHCHLTQDCPTAFLHQADSLDTILLLIPFGFFFFLMRSCEFCLPIGITAAVAAPQVSAAASSLKVLSPPPRFSH